VIFATCGIVWYKCTNGDGKVGETVNVDGKNYELLKHKIDTIFVDHTKIKYVRGKDIYHETIVEKEKRIEVPVYTKGDTVRIVQSYNQKVLYKDKLVLDNNLGTIELTDTLYQNKILGRKWNTTIKERTITDTKIVKELPKNQVYVGVNGALDKVNFGNSIGAGVILKSKTDKLYQLNIGISNQQNTNGANNVVPYIGGGVYWKIKFK
jgi:adenosyl cobinamide kinase/adenosyl cobinamide phosphate guanylyltransferase